MPAMFNDVLRIKCLRHKEMEQVHKSLHIGVCCFRRAALWCNLSGTGNSACYRRIDGEAASGQLYGAIGWEQQIQLAMKEFTGSSKSILLWGIYREAVFKQFYRVIQREQ